MSQIADEKAAKAAEKAQKAAAAQAPPPGGEKVLDTQQIKFLRSHPGYAYWPGDTADLTAEHVTLLVDGGFAKLAAEPETEAEE